MTDDLSVAGMKIPPAVRTAGVAAASGAAVVVVRHAIARGAQKTKQRSPDDPFGAALDAGWAVARDALRPAVEDTAAAAGRYAGEKLPDALLEVALPRFLEGFHEARERREADADEAALADEDSDGGDDDD
jgi:hypothetical protein